MAKFPVPTPEDEKLLYPPYTGISFSYLTRDPETKKPIMVKETMIEEDSSKKYDVKLFNFVFGVESVDMTPQQVRFLVKSFLALLIAQGQFIEQKRNGGNNPPPRSGNILGV